jgi:hypothetical protein
MRRFALTISLALLPLAATPRHVGVARAARQCPTVKVSCPDSVPNGDEITFNLEFDAAASAVKNTFNWQTSAGTIASGQGTLSLKVDSTGIAGQPVTATVEVTGLPSSCGNSSSCTTIVMSRLIGCGFDEYGDIPFEDEQARLDNFAMELQNDPTSQGYLICYGGRVGYEGEARRRCDRAKGYLSNTRDISADRIVTVDGGYREDLTVKVVVVPSGATPPAPSPTVDPRNVVIIKRKAGRKPGSR